ncbi:hypothetical protein MATR_04120 [Marivirga tractuosa]|jgi:Flp pilus assembly protein TadB|uniref:Transmembrane HD family protein n=1 Tax=Marivirga tractuosa (strain ATCC 23168 / DSM 4126 / NBRC 15989 / NCIMB 1408 / VKM B-1430 / H-43) TaxID=643867 RepID=E4TTC3_MARTH|nr:hypothetical protein [Marivirga tractuosa]ADR21953.1 putative transmembrane HD family protein [Marivirga tractuosa DSM 4126]BDD13587.1 hypothetical protein MATR_04120 [Marivirga tractuosa]
MTFMSHMKKESTRKAFDKQSKVNGTSRYEGYDPSKVKTDFEELKRLRNKKKNRTWNLLKAIFLSLAFILVIFMLLNLFIGIL